MSVLSVCLGARYSFGYRSNLQLLQSLLFSNSSTLPQLHPVHVPRREALGLVDAALAVRQIATPLPVHTIADTVAVQVLPARVWIVSREPTVMDSSARAPHVPSRSFAELATFVVCMLSPSVPVLFALFMP